ncbi:MAG: DNA (cytosine-5-)-methyltransferase [Bacillota bacterium]|nr:DNA (cytosine-5-)-methyltransferase [Bacillota bacterium]
MTASQKKIKPKKTLTLLSLFSGCGGIDLGFEGDFNVLRKSINLAISQNWDISDVDDYWVKLGKTRFHTIFANDIKPEAKAAWVNYFSKRKIDPRSFYLDSIVDLVKLQRENGINIFPAKADVLIGGFPCQDFSVAGKRMGFQSSNGHDGKKIDRESPTVENRGQLYMWMREVIGIVKPKVFVAENVKGLTNLNDAKDIIERDFASVCSGGYLVVPAKVLNAACYGVPQGRERVIFFGFKKSELLPKALKELSKEELPLEYTPYPQKTHYLRNEVETNELKKYVTVKDALVGLEEPENSRDASHQRYSKAKYMGKHCQGQQEVRLDSIGPTIRAEHHGNIEFRRLAKEHGGRYNDELEDGLRERRLSVRECARIQTFPDDYEFVISAKNGNKSVSGSEAYKIIGNAVPPLLGYHIAKRLEENWELYFGEDCK